MSFSVGPKFADIDALLRYCSEKQFGWQRVKTEIANHYEVGDVAAQNIWYVLQRSRGTEEHVARLVKADKVKEFDWSSVARGEEHEELQKYGI